MWQTLRAPKFEQHRNVWGSWPPRCFAHTVYSSWRQLCCIFRQGLCLCWVYLKRCKWRLWCGLFWASSCCCDALCCSSFCWRFWAFKLHLEIRLDWLYFGVGFNVRQYYLIYMIYQLKAYHVIYQNLCLYFYEILR